MCQHFLPQHRLICCSVLCWHTGSTDCQNFLCHMCSESYHTNRIIPYQWNHTIPTESYHTNGIIPYQWNHTTPMESYHTNGIIPYQGDHTIPRGSYHTIGMEPYHTNGTIDSFQNSIPAKTTYHSHTIFVSHSKVFPYQPSGKLLIPVLR